MTVFDFQTVTAVKLVTASFRHLSPAFCKRTSEQILSDSLDFVIVRAVALMALFITAVSICHSLHMGADSITASSNYCGNTPSELVLTHCVLLYSKRLMILNLAILQKRRTIRESTKKLKSNGFRGSTSAAALMSRTPDSSLTLSVGSLPQRPIYPSKALHPWKGDGKD